MSTVVERADTGLPTETLPTDREPIGGHGNPVASNVPGIRCGTDRGIGFDLDPARRDDAKNRHTAGRLPCQIRVSTLAALAYKHNVAAGEVIPAAQSNGARRLHVGIGERDDS